MWGKFASRRGEARYPSLWDARVAAWSPSVTGPTGTRLYDLQFGRYQGTLTNMDSPTDWVRSSGQYALDFDGVDDNVIARATLSGPFTVSIWGNRRTAGSGSSRVIWGADSTTYIATIKPTAVGTRSDTTTEVNFSGFTFTNNVWFHLVISRDAANGVRIWKDGVQSTSGSQAVSGTYTLNALGRYSTASIYWWDGLIDDVAVYKRALTSGEIRTLSRLRGIAYEARRQDFVAAGFKPYWSRQRTQLIGGGLR